MTPLQVYSSKNQNNSHSYNNTRYKC